MLYILCTPSTWLIKFTTTLNTIDHLKKDLNGLQYTRWIKDFKHSLIVASIHSTVVPTFNDDKVTNWVHPTNIGGI